MATRVKGRERLKVFVAECPTANVKSNSKLTGNSSGSSRPIQPSPTSASPLPPSKGGDEDYNESSFCLDTSSWKREAYRFLVRVACALEGGGSRLEREGGATLAYRVKEKSTMSVEQ